MAEAESRLSEDRDPAIGQEFVNVRTGVHVTRVSFDDDESTMMVGRRDIQAMPLPDWPIIDADHPNVTSISKGIGYILRHGAKEKGIPKSPAGCCLIQDIAAVLGYPQEIVYEVARQNAKARLHLPWHRGSRRVRRQTHPDVAVMHTGAL